jgi:hypothetical protein
VNIEFDHPTFVKWSPDSKAFIVHKFNENAIEVYKVEKKKDGWLGHSTKALTFPKVNAEQLPFSVVSKSSTNNKSQPRLAVLYNRIDLKSY